MPDQPIGTLIDSNVLLDVMTGDDTWADWSTEALVAAIDSGPVCINPIIYSEVSIRFSAIEDLEASLPATEFRRESIPWSAAFLAGKAFLAYRRNRGTRQTPLPDFFIGAHAAVSGLQLLTRDTNRYRTYFPTVTVIAPQSPPAQTDT